LNFIAFRQKLANFASLCKFLAYSRHVSALFIKRRTKRHAVLLCEDMNSKESSKNRKLTGEKQSTFSKFLSPYGRMLPNGNIKVFGEEKPFCSIEHIYDISMMKEA